MSSHLLSSVKPRHRYSSHMIWAHSFGDSNVVDCDVRSKGHASSCNDFNRCLAIVVDCGSHNLPAFIGIQIFVHCYSIHFQLKSCVLINMHVTSKFNAETSAEATRPFQDCLVSLPRRSASFQVHIVFSIIGGVRSCGWWACRSFSQKPTSFAGGIVSPSTKISALKWCRYACWKSVNRVFACWSG